jgi:restriction endonuclease Mrr
VCTGCAVTERFALKTKYFYDEDNRDTFREEYEQMPIREKAMENKPLTGGSMLVGLLLVLGALLAFGIV